MNENAGKRPWQRRMGSRGNDPVQGYGMASFSQSMVSSLRVDSQPWKPSLYFIFFAGGKFESNNGDFCVGYIHSGGSGMPSRSYLQSFGARLLCTPVPAFSKLP
jgi:hypothetical protein